jgi:hypothetical protein
MDELDKLLLTHGLAADMHFLTGKGILREADIAASTTCTVSQAMMTEAFVRRSQKVMRSVSWIDANRSVTEHQLKTRLIVCRHAAF